MFNKTLFIQLLSFSIAILIDMLAYFNGFFHYTNSAVGKTTVIEQSRISRTTSRFSTILTVYSTPGLVGVFFAHSVHQNKEHETKWQSRKQIVIMQECINNTVQILLGNYN